MSLRLSAAKSRQFDVLVIGGGINGASAALEISKNGYSVLLVEKGDFGSGTSSRSTRLLHLGLRYFANGSDTPIRSFLGHPRSLLDAARMAKLAMKSREEFILERPNRANPLNVFFPLERAGSYRPFHLRLGMAALRLLGASKVPIGDRKLSSRDIEAHALLSAMNRRAPLRSVYAFRDYQFDWPERIINDMALETVANGGTAINYAEVKEAEHANGSWKVTIADTLDLSAEKTVAEARCIVNLAGIWLDKVNSSMRLKSAARKITGTKGSHIAIRLPAEFADFAIMTMNSHGQPIYCIPWKGMHYVGATETYFEGELEHIVPGEEEVNFLLDEARLLLPSLSLNRSDILYAWSGVRPWTYDENMLAHYLREKKLSNPIGSRRRELHDLSEPGAPNVLGLTAGPIMLHRQTGRDMAEAVATKIGPSAGGMVVPAPAPMASDLLLKATGDLHQAVRVAVEQEQAAGLIDVMFRRLGLGWDADMGISKVQSVAEALGEVRAWSRERTKEEIQVYNRYLEKNHLFKHQQQTSEIAI